jgi:PAS domain S-box-containing protein
MKLRGQNPWYAEANRARCLTFATVLITVIAVVDWFTIPTLGLGFLYFFPLLLASAFLSRWQILSLALVCAALREMFAYFPPGPEMWLRIVFVYVAYAVVGILIRDMVVYRRAALRHLRDLEREVALRHQAEEQLERLINSSPAGIVTVSAEGKIVRCNEAAHQIFGVSTGALRGQLVGSFLPELEQMRASHTELANPAAIACRGRRANGEGFLAHVWVSSFSGAAGPTLAAIVLDAAQNPHER